MELSANLLIIGLTCIVSFYGFNNREFFNKLMHYPFQENKDKSFSRWMSSGFLHKDQTHLLFNMITLYFFGPWVEDKFISLFDEATGRTIYILTYILMIALANIPSFLKHKNNPRFSAIGASGAVSGVVFMYILMAPWKMLYIMFAIPCPAIVAGIAYLAYSAWASKNKNDGIGHMAHFYGALSGILILILLDKNIISSFMENLANVPFL